MLDDFILDQLNEIELEYQKLNSMLVELSEEEQAEQLRMDQFFEKEDMGLEIFSPRTGSASLKEKIAEGQKHLEEIHIAQMDISDRIAKNREKEEKYQKMLNESRMSHLEGENSSDIKHSSASEDEEKTNAIKSQYVEDLKEVLQRIDRCINLVNHDRNKCKSELKNLRYYLKALITDDSEKS